MESINQTNKPNLNTIYRRCLDVLDEYHYDNIDVEGESLYNHHGRIQLAENLSEAIQELVTSE